MGEIGRGNFNIRASSVLFFTHLSFLLALEAYEIANAMEPHDEETKRNIATLQSLLQEKEMALHAEGQSNMDEDFTSRPRVDVSTGQ